MVTKLPMLRTATPLTRRAWLQRGMALASAGALLPDAWAAADAQPAILTAWDSAQQSWAGVWRPGSAPRGVALPARAHEVLPVPRHLLSAKAAPQAIAVARRPGEYLLRFDTASARAIQWHAMEDDRLLVGHAVFSADGHTLYTTETDTETGQGVIALRNPLTLAKRAEFSSAGIGPHAVLLEDAGTLLVANGGILTLPETGRRKLNTPRMEPNIARLNASTGAVIARWQLEDPALSLRHMAVSPQGTVAVALQSEHTDAAARAQAPLLALLSGNTLRGIPLPAGTALAGYAGDVAYMAEGMNWQGAPAPAGFVLSATRANQLVRWSEAGEWQGTLDLPEAGALLTHGTQWLATGAQGQYTGSRAAAIGYSPLVRWDNHARSLG